jgi:hypothetical protein
MADEKEALKEKVLKALRECECAEKKKRVKAMVETQLKQVLDKKKDDFR